MFSFKKIFSNLLIVLIFLSLTLLFTYPAIFHLKDKYIGDGGDNYIFLLYQHITASKLKNFQWPFTQSLVLRFPVGIDFSRTTDSFFNTLLGGVLELLFPFVIAYNFTVLLSLLLNTLTSYLLFHYLSKSKYLGVIGAVIYGLSFYVLARGAGHPHNMVAAGFPLFIYALLRLKTRKRLVDFFLVFFSIFLLSISFAQHLLLFSVFAFINLILGLLIFPEEAKSFWHLLITRKLRLVFSLLIVGFVFLGLFFPMLKAIAAGEFLAANRLEAALGNKIYLQEYLLPNSFLKIVLADYFSASTPASIENVVFLGWVELVLFLLYLGLEKQSKTKLFITFNVVIFFILSLGIKSPDLPFLLPYSFLYKFFPFYFIPQTARFYLIFYLFMTIGIIQLLKKVKNKWLLGFILILIVLERVTTHYYLTETFVDKPYVRVAAKTNSLAVLDLPVSYFNSVYDVLAPVYQKNIVSGYFHWSVDDAKARSFIEQNGLTNFMCGGEFDSTFDQNKLVNLLRTEKIMTMVVHKNDPEDHAKFYFPNCANARIQTSLLLPQLFMPFPTEKQAVLSLFFPTQPGIGETVKLVKPGTFYLDGIQAYPGDLLPIVITVDGQETTLSDNWQDKGGGNFTLDPFLAIPVQAGSQISFRLANSQNNTYSLIKLWYRYQVTSPVTDNDYQNELGIVKIYEDEESAVFRVN